MYQEYVYIAIEILEKQTNVFGPTFGRTRLGDNNTVLGLSLAKISFLQETTTLPNQHPPILRQTFNPKYMPVTTHTPIPTIVIHWYIFMFTSLRVSTDGITLLRLTPVRLMWRRNSDCLPHIQQ